MSEGSDFESVRQVPVGVCCCRCDYDLRGWHDNAVCPECGLDIAISLIPLRVVTATPRRARRVICGINCIEASVPATLFALPVSGALWDLGWPLPAVLALPFSGAALRGIAVWLLTMRATGDSPAGPSSSEATKYRAVAATDILCHILVAIAIGVGAGSWWFSLSLTLAVLMAAAASSVARRSRQVSSLDLPYYYAT